MPNSIHGHAVLKMMLTSTKGFTKKSLIAAIQKKFGKSARFHTCSAEAMSAAELVNFLESKGKFIPSDGGFNTDPSKICDH